MEKGVRYSLLKGVCDYSLDLRQVGKIIGFTLKDLQEVANLQEGGPLSRSFQIANGGLI